MWLNVSEFEVASGQRVNRVKSALIPACKLIQEEEAAMLRVMGQWATDLHAWDGLDHTTRFKCSH